MDRLEVQVEEDHLRRLVRPSQPVAGLIELIWNALDADADHVVVAFEESEMGGITGVVISDDGHGMPPAEAREAFRTLGGSWKARAARSKSKGRSLHGSEGKGRWRAFSVGDHVRWRTVAQVDDGRVLTVIDGRTDALRQFEVSEPQATDEPTGTTVTISQVPQEERGLRNAATIQKLLTAFALHLEKYPVSITYAGQVLDPKKIQRHRAEYDLPTVGDLPSPTLIVIEWFGIDERTLYFCDEDGSALGETKAGIRAPGFDFTAYVKWRGYSQLVNELELAELGHPLLGPVLEAARDRLRQHFRDRGSELTKSLIDEWKAEEVYPYREEPTTELDVAERDLFEVVALTAAKAVNATDDKRARRLSLKLIREALVHSPAALQRVLQEVLDLSPERLEELSQLLEHSPLTSVIQATKVITDRLDFLKSLEILVFDPEARGKVLERRHLHRILAAEPWVFGEEYAVSADDESLTTVLRRHVELLGRDDLAPTEEATDEHGRRLIIDLLLSRSVEHNHNQREHLVVELKRPTVVAGAEEITQIKRYALAVASDARFAGQNTRWDFMLVTAELDAYARQEVSQQRAATQPGLIHDGSDGVRIWLKTWAEIISECEHRLKFVKNNLGYAATEESALRYLRAMHAKYLPEVLHESTATTVS